MPTIRVTFTHVPGTEAALGRAGPHSVLADRPEGVAGGLGLGLNGAQLLALALGGCFCNDLRYIAHRRGVAIAALSVEVALTLEGDPPVASAAAMPVDCRMEGGSDATPLVEEAKRTSMVAISLARGVPVEVAEA